MSSDLEDRTGQSIEGVDLSGSTLSRVRLDDVTIRDADLYRMRLVGVEIMDTSIDGEVLRLLINGVDVAPLVEAELDRRDPDRVLFRPTSADGFRAAWDLDQRLWAATVERARRLDPDQLAEQVDGEWSFIQTLRHLAFASESWVGRCVLGDPRPWHPLSLPWDQMAPHEGVPHDRSARPSLDEALELRHAAMNLVRGVVDGITDDRLDEQTAPLVGPGWPDEGATFPVRKCLSIVLNEEWQHRQYAERDLAVLEARAAGRGDS